ncbi:MAG: glycosyltransferase family 4 protein [Candidatus Hodarchaeota archaeon]
MRNLKVCFIGNLPKPYGGVASHCYHLVKALIESHVKILMVDTIPAVDKKVLQDLIYKDIKISKIKIFLRLLIIPLLFFKYLIIIFKFGKTLGKYQAVNMAAIVIKIIEFHEKYNLNVIHSQHCTERSLASLVAAQHIKKPLVITIHGAELTYDPFWEKNAEFIQHVILHADKIITVSNYTGSYLQKRGIYKNFTVIPNGIDSLRFAPMDISELRKKHDLKYNDKILLFTGAISKRKGLDILLNSLLLIHQKDFKLVIVGTKGDLWTKLNSLISKLRINDKVLVVGEVLEEALPAYYNLTDIFIFPTNWKTEGFGIVALEAMACAKPVIASRIGPIPEIVKDNFNGLLFEAGNEKDLARKIDLLLSDELLRQRLGNNGRILVKSEYTWASIAEKTKKIYHACAI